MNLADLFETVVDAVGERDALVTAERRLTYAELDERANRLAHHLAAQGVGPGDHVGLQFVNGTEYVEGMLAAYKIRAVPINVNYRYVEAELTYLFDDADLVALIVNDQFARQRPGRGRPEAAAHVGGRRRRRLRGRARRPRRRTGPTPPRSGDDLYCVYTGGTTGMPKGVLWRHEDIFFGAMGGGDPMQMGNTIKARRRAAVADPGVRSRRPGHAAAHARQRAVDRVLTVLRRRQDHLHTGRPLRRARDPHADRRREGQHARDRRRRHGPAARRRAGAPRPVPTTRRR